MNIRKIPIDQINPAAYNPRKDLQPGDPEYEKIKRSIEEFGLVETLVWNKRTGNLVGGHQRLKVLKELGYTEADVSVVDLSEDKEKALNIALNKIQGDWDYLKLKDLLQELDTGEFDLELTGFDMDEIEDLMTQFHVPGEIEEDEVPEPPKEPITKPGDLWILGRHRLMCGDSTSIDDVGKLMNGKKADLVYTDPPYGVNYKSNMSNRFDVLKNDDGFLDFIPCLLEYSKQNIHWYIWTSHNVYPTWREMFNDYYKHTVIWYKGGGGMGDLEGNYASDYEMALFCHFGRKELNGKRSGAVWEIQKDNNGSYVHPTQKPIALAAKALKHSSNPNEIVLDLFGGSGSTLIACEQLNRTCYMMELDPVYCDVIVQRWENFTGQKAVMVE